MLKSLRFQIVIVLLCTPLMATAEPGERLVTTSGSAEIRVAPDEVVLELAVRTYDAELARAKRQNDAIVTAAIEAVAASGAGADRVQADQMSIVPKHDQRSGDHAIKGYDVSTRITVTSARIDSVAELLTAVLDAGVNTVQGVEFRTTDFRQHRDEALLLALDAARAKAELMAKRLGAAIGSPVAIQEGGGVRRPSPLNTMRTVSEVDTAGNGPLAPGEVSVAARVKVSFELLD